MSAGVRAPSVVKHAGRSLVRGRRASRGFTLLELMVVVIIVGLLAALAVPTMSLAMYDRNAYSDAGAVMGLFRSARTRAIGRGGAVLIKMTSNGTTDRGTFLVYDAVAANAGGGAGDLTPVATCKSPVDWTIANMNAVDGVNINGGLEQSGGIQAQIFSYAGSTSTQLNTAFVCYTPLGRSYVPPAGFSSLKPSFDGQLPNTSPVEVRVLRNGGATIRSVLVPPTGMARLFSHT
jgi:prepilin-type N-terminal cleavage/methylation domain-containing protein